VYKIQKTNIALNNVLCSLTENQIFMEVTHRKLLEK